MNTNTPWTKERYEQLGCELWHRVWPHPGDTYKDENCRLTEVQAEMVWGTLGRCAVAYAAGQAETSAGLAAPTPDYYKALVELAARVLLQHLNDEDYEMSLAELYAKLTEDES